LNNLNPEEEREKLRWDPPKPKRVEGIQDLINLFQKEFTTDKFKASIATSFDKTGIAPLINGDGVTFAEYTVRNDCTGTTRTIPNGTMDSIDTDVVPDTDAQGSELIRNAIDMYLDDADKDNQSDDEDFYFGHDDALAACL
jgi:hypothetical protein